MAEFERIMRTESSSCVYEGEVQKPGLFREKKKKKHDGGFKNDERFSHEQLIVSREGLNFSMFGACNTVQYSSFPADSFLSSL